MATQRLSLLLENHTLVEGSARIPKPENPLTSRPIRRFNRRRREAEERDCLCAEFGEEGGF
jgi:hypothetical protein